MFGDWQTMYFTEHLDCLKEIQLIRKDYNRIFIGRGKNDKGYYITYKQRL